MAVRLGDAVVYLLGDRKGFDQVLNGAKQSADGWARDVGRQVNGGITGALKGAGGAVTGLVGTLGKIGLAGMGVQVVTSAVDKLGDALGVGLASDLNESANKVEVVFGQAAGVVKDFGTTAAQNIGLSNAAALEAAGTFGNLFTTMGVGKQQAAGMSTEVLTLGADLASFNNLGVDETLEKIRSGLVGESEPLRSLGILLTEETVKAKGMAMGLGDATGKLSEAEKVQARYALIVEQSAVAHGDFARTSDGMANASRIINASLADLRTTVGQALLPTIAPLVASFARALPGAIRALQPLIAGLGNAFAGLVSSLQGMMAGAGRVFEAVKPYVSTFFDLFKRGDAEHGLNVLAVGFQRLTGIDLSGPLGVLRELVQAVQDLGSKAAPYLQVFFDLIKRGDFGSAFRTVALGLERLLPEIQAKLGEWAQAFLNWIGPLIPPLVAQLGTLAGQVVAWVVERRAQFAEQVLTWAQAFVEWVTPLIKPLTAELLKMATGILEYLKAQVPVFAKQLGEWANAFIQWAIAAVPPLLEALAGLAEDLLDWITEEGPPLAEKLIGEWLPAFLEWLAKAAVEVVPKLLELVLAIGNWVLFTGVPKILELGLKMGGAILSGFGEAFGNLAPKLQAWITEQLQRLDFWVGPFHVTGQGITFSLPNPVSGEGTGYTPETPAQRAGRMLENYAEGGSFLVGGTGGTDSQLVQFMATPRERVTVTTPEQQASGVLSVTASVNVYGPITIANDRDERRFFDRLGASQVEALKRALGQDVRRKIGASI